MTSIAGISAAMKIPANMTEILIAFGAGLISFLSPCVLPLIFYYISYISGTT